MTDPIGQASTPSGTTEYSDGNPFAELVVEDQQEQRTPPRPTVQEPAAQSEPAVEPSREVVGNTNDSINASLDEIEDPGVLKALVSRLRHENGNHRRGKQDLQKQVDELTAWKVDHLSKVQEAKEDALRAKATAKQYVMRAAAAEYDVDDDLVDLLDASTEEEIWEKAKRLAATKKRKPSYETPTSIDTFPGRRGRPVGAPQRDGGGEFLRDLFNS